MKICIYQRKSELSSNTQSYMDIKQCVKKNLKPELKIHTSIFF